MKEITPVREKVEDFTKRKLIVLIGPTGIGKTDLSIRIAQHFGAEIISSDSRQVYKELSIGTAVPSEQELAAVKHHLIQTKSIYDYYNASMFEFEVLDLLQKMYQTNEYAMLVGGSGMYVDAVCRGIDDLPTIDTELRNDLLRRLDDEGIESLRFELQRIDPEYYAIADVNNSKRILKALEVFYMTGKKYSSFRVSEIKKRPFEIIKIGLTMDREKLYERINLRVDQMMEAGLLKEAALYHKDKKLNSLNTVGYKELFAYMDGDIPLEEAVRLIKRNSRRYAKRQWSWFRRDKEINWFEPSQEKEIMEKVENLF